MGGLFGASSFVTKDGVISGAVRNCYVRLDTADKAPALEVFFPKSADDDRWEIRPFLNQPYIIRQEWIDSGLRIFFNGIPPRRLSETAEPLIDKITAHFSAKYSGDVFRRYKNYSSGSRSRVILLHINNTVVLKYCEELRADFTKNYMKVIVNETETIEKVYINTYEMGTLEYKHGRIEMHRWENEDEARDASYWSKRYTQRLLNGIVNESGAKAGMIGILKSSMSGAAIEPEDSRVFGKAFAFLENSAPERSL